MLDLSDRLGVRDPIRAAKAAFLLVREGGVRSQWLDARHITEPSAIPPAGLLYLVQGTFSGLGFHESGAHAAALVRSVLAESGISLNAGCRILDFGCGCGRVLRWWKGEDDVSWYGCDYNDKLIRWAVGHLSFACFSVNDSRPPTVFETGFFDALYAISVLTHLSADLQELWMREWARILKPGGTMIVTTHGPKTCPTPADLEERGLIVNREHRSGQNLCATYNSYSDVVSRLGAGMSLSAYRPGANPWSGQDVYAFRASGPSRGSG